MSTDDLLLEIGTEEIPASFLLGAIDSLAHDFVARLKRARLAHQSVRVLATPRRIAVIVTGLATHQSELSEIIVGPPAQNAFDATGAPTSAALGFARKNALDVAGLTRGEVPGRKGEYVLGMRKEVGQPAQSVLPNILTTFIRELEWPKSMRWGWHEGTFVRPLHWIVALLGSQVIPVELFGIVAGRETRGHRFLAPLPIEVNVENYESRLRESSVIVDQVARRALIAAEIDRIERETGARVRSDPGLLDEVSFLVEFPVGVFGQFNPAFLELPEEVIVSAMRAHQRYFAMVSNDGALANRFVTIAGTAVRDLDVVRRGNERVLAARLTDAQFFFREDRKRSLDSFATGLHDVIFIKQLGSIGAKVRRIGVLADRLATMLGIDRGATARAAALCKADLVTTMVYEFPDLQGIVGAHYARLGGEAPEVAAAI